MMNKNNYEYNSDSDLENNQNENETFQLKAPPLEIPLRNETKQETGEVVSFDPFDLPPAEDVIEVLIDQEAAQMRWLRFAAAYFRVGKVRDAEKVLITIKGDYIPYRSNAPQNDYGRKKRANGGNEFNPDKLYYLDQEGRALIGNALAALYLHFAREHRMGTRQSADKEPEPDKPISILINSNDFSRMEPMSHQQLLARAESLLIQAESHSKTERVASITWSTKGEMQMEQYFAKLTKGGMSQTEVEKNLNQMAQSFQTSLDLRSGCMRAMFGKASILFQKGQFKEARDQYARAIQKYPGADPGPTRVALGLCYYELGQEGRAQECFERALELDPKSVDAQVCLAIIEMGLATDAERAAGATAIEIARNQETAKRLRERANDRLRVAYDLDKWNPLLKIHLANNFFHSSPGSRDYKRVGDLAKEAFNHTSSKFIKAEACFISARNYHDQGDTRNAATLYSKGLDHWYQFPLARYGHAQMELTQTKPDLSAALRAIQLVTESPEGKDDEDCLLMVGALHAKMHNIEAALQALRRVTDKNPYRAEAWLQQALLEQSKYRQLSASAEESIRCYDKAVTALKFNKEVVPFELYNNVGALKFRMGDYPGSLAAFNSAIEIQGSKIYDDDDESKIKLDMVTLVFNKARALEGLGRFEEAEAIYAKLTKSFPGEVHVDAQLRQAAIYADRGDFETSIETYMKPLTSSISKSNISDYYCFYGDLEIERSKQIGTASAKALAEGKFKKVLDTNKHDPYARLSIANLSFEEAQALGQRKEDREKSGQLVQTSLGVYRTVLKMHPTNVFAANGIGASQAVRGRYESARLILDKVREFADAVCPSVWINLAHVYVHEGAYEQAASLYDQCLKRFYDSRDPEISLYLANARFQAGKYSEARASILNAIKQTPSDDNLWFASATIDEADAYQKLALDPKLRTVTLVEQAKKCLDRALDIYVWMIAKAQTRQVAKQNTGSVKLSTALEAFKEFSSNPSQLPRHIPTPPISGEGSKPTSILAARARVARAELEGKTPDSADMELVKKANEIKTEKAQIEIDSWKARGRRPDIDRAIPPNAKPSSASGFTRLSHLAAKRADIVREEMKKTSTYLEAQKKILRKIEADRKKLEEIRLLEQKKREEEERIRLDAEEEERQKMLERAAKLAKRNEELQKRFEEEENELAQRGTRRSSRPRKKSRKMKEAEEVKIISRKRKANSDSSSDSDDEDEEDDDFQEEVEEEETPIAPEETSDDENSPKTEEEIKVASELENLVNKAVEEEGEEEAQNKGVKWFQNKCKETLGEDAVAKLEKEFFENRILKLFTKINQKNKKKHEEEEKKAVEEKKKAHKPKRTRKIVSEESSSSDDEDEYEKPATPQTPGDNQENEDKLEAETPIIAAGVQEDEEEEFL